MCHENECSEAHGKQKQKKVNGNKNEKIRIGTSITFILR